MLSNVKEIKLGIDPCEIRVKTAVDRSVQKELNHPFLYVPINLKEICLIGTQDETRLAEQKILKFLKQKRCNTPTIYNLSFLLPEKLKDYMEQYKKTIRVKFNNNVHLNYYLPTFPRKHLTV